MIDELEILRSRVAKLEKTAPEKIGDKVSREKEIEEELKKSERRYRAIVQDQAELICRFLPDGTLTFVNDAYCRYFGRKQAELISRSFMTLIPEEDRDMVHKQFNSLTYDNPVATCEHRVILPSGEISWMSWSDQAIFDDQNRLMEFQSVGRDITQRKRMEEELQKAKNELEKQVRDRTAELSLKNEQLLRKVEEHRQTEKELQEAFANLTDAHKELEDAQLQIIQAARMESVGILAAGVAHEVKNPLATILMGIEYLSNAASSGDETIKAILEDMEQAVNRADSIVRGLLDFSYVGDMTFQPYQLNHAILKSIDLVRHELDRKNIKLITGLSATLPVVCIDEDRICQVFVNLFLNAVHAVPDGGNIMITAYEKTVTKSDLWKCSGNTGKFKIGDGVIVVEIEDRGRGIPEDQIMKVFDPFFTTRPAGEGTGLGLTVSRSIVESHGGKLDIVNRKDGGVRSTIVFKR